MEREIKFKYGYSDGINTFEKSFTLEEIEQGLQFEEISDSPLLKNYKIVYKRQYTGLKDKLKTESFDGDIVKYTNETIATVEWDYINTGWICRSIKQKLRTWALCDSLLDGALVIGNIYENQDLLKG